MKNFTLLFISLFAANLLNAQGKSKDADSLKYYSHGYFSFTYSNQNFPSLNSRIVRYYPKSIPQNYVGIAWGGKSGWGTLAAQGEMGVAMAFNGKRSEGSTMAATIYASMDAGVFLNGIDNIRIYPFAGLGIDFAMVRASSSNKNIAFDSLLANPVTRSATEPVGFNNFYFTWRAGLAFDIGNAKHTGQPYNIGLRAGYKQSFNDSEWNFNGRSGFAGSPSDKLKQWFAALVIYGPYELISRSNSRRK